mmetsp:Transcript_8070/g.11728  ORF Transcript_8070/g.11728 Transcript_8070/m.11728 type:complete len:332 (+) Transcript_8070:78-1073(+)
MPVLLQSKIYGFIIFVFIQGHTGTHGGITHMSQHSMTNAFIEFRTAMHGQQESGQTAQDNTRHNHNHHHRRRISLYDNNGRIFIIVRHPIIITTGTILKIQRRNTTKITRDTIQTMTGPIGIEFLIGPFDEFISRGLFQLLIRFARIFTCLINCVPQSVAYRFLLLSTLHDTRKVSLVFRVTRRRNLGVVFEIDRVRRNPLTVESLQITPRRFVKFGLKVPKIEAVSNARKGVDFFSCQIAHHIVGIVVVGKCLRWGMNPVTARFGVTGTFLFPIARCGTLVEDGATHACSIRSLQWRIRIEYGGIINQMFMVRLPSVTRHVFTRQTWKAR